MKYIFYSPFSFEEWDYRSRDIGGIGGSETSHMEMCWRLAQRANEVISYSYIPDDCDRSWRGVQWRHIDDVNFSEDGIWIIYRAPEAADKFIPTPGQELWLMCQDVDYPATITEERISKFSKVITLCDDHTSYMLGRYPYMRGKIFQSSNGIRVDLMRELINGGDLPERDPNRIMYASSPDRGLLYCLETFRYAREFYPELEFHLYYGWDNMDRLIERNDRYSGKIKSTKESILKAMNQPNVYWHGRTGQRELYKEWLKSSIFLYQTLFKETSCISIMESQALGVVPISNPVWGILQNGLTGIYIDGDAYHDKLVKARYLGELIRLISDTELQDTMRNYAIPHATKGFNWERMVDQWEAIVGGYADTEYGGRFGFQMKHSRGKILNVGCNTDVSHLGDRLGAINVDLFDVDPFSGIPNPHVDIKADARNLPECLHGRFDTVILGDILEHFTDDDICRALNSAKKCLSNNGRIVITYPEDHREPPSEESHDGYHYHRLIPINDMMSLIDRCGLHIDIHYMIDYGLLLQLDIGHGIVCTPLE